MLVFGDGVLTRKLASVVGLAVVPRGLHPSSAQSTAHEARQHVGMSGLGFSDCGPLSRVEDVSSCFELFERDEWLVGLFLGPDPIGLVVPSHLALVTEGDIIHVDALVATMSPFAGEGLGDCIQALASDDRPTLAETIGSGTRRWSRCPIAALLGFGCGPASPSM